EFFFEARREIAIDLDRGQVRDPREQRARQRALPRADLDDAIVARRRDRIDDASQHPGVVQEMLSETLALNVRCAPRATCLRAGSQRTSCRAADAANPGTPRRTCARAAPGAR